jgi:hypothetical protein
MTAPEDYAAKCETLANELREHANWLHDHYGVSTVSAEVEKAAAALSRVPKLVAALRTARMALCPGDAFSVDNAYAILDDTLAALEGVDE